MTFHHRSHAHTYTLTEVVSAAAVEWKKTIVHRTPPLWMCGLRPLFQQLCVWPLARRKDSALRQPLDAGASILFI